MVAVGRGHEPLTALRLQVVLTHETADLLGIDENAAMAQLGTNPTIAVGRCGTVPRCKRFARPAMSKSTRSRLSAELMIAARCPLGHDHPKPRRSIFERNLKDSPRRVISLCVACPCGPPTATPTAGVSRMQAETR